MLQITGSTNVTNGIALDADNQFIIGAIDAKVATYRDAVIGIVRVAASVSFIGATDARIVVGRTVKPPAATTEELAARNLRRIGEFLGTGHQLSLFSDPLELDEVSQETVTWHRETAWAAGLIDARAVKMLIAGPASTALWGLGDLETL